MFKITINKEEWIDSSNCPEDIVKTSHYFMTLVNRFLGGTAAVKNFVRQAWSVNPSGKRLKILDIGSGSADIPIDVLKWANRKNIKLDFTCIEKSTAAITLKKNENLSHLTFINDDIFDHDFKTSFDYAIASMFMHHLNDQQIIALTRKLKTFVHKSFFINDLHRSVITYGGCLVVAPFLLKEVRHDALLSIKKGFKKKELTELFAAADFPVTVETRPFGRITASIKFEGEIN